MRVRKFGLSLAAPSVLYLLGEGVYRALAFASVGRTPLLPRLTDLCPERPIDEDDKYPRIGLFLSPSIQNLKFIIDGETDYIVNAWLSLLPPLVSACPNLTHLSLLGRKSLPWQEIIFTISAISHWSSLRHLTASSPSLRESELIKYLVENNAENPSMPKIDFAKLERLDIVYSAIEFSIRLLDCMSQAGLQTLHVGFSNDLREDQWSKLFKAVQHGISCSSLRDIHISCNRKEITSTPRASMTFDALLPLLAFTCLTQVSLVNHGFDLNDENLQIMASAWSCLQTLKLITLSLTYRSQITINGLSALVQHCPSLANLTIPFDASQAYLRAEGGPRNERILTLGVSHSPVGDLDTTAALLSDMFPNLRSIDVCQCRIKNRRDHAGGDADDWKEVELLVARRSS